MPVYQRFEDLPVWREAARLYHLVLDFLEHPPSRLSVGFRQQLDRSALSVSNNIAEGFERVTTGELLAFLAFARGSAGEVRSMLAVIRERPGLSGHQAELKEIVLAAESCSRQLTAWMRQSRQMPGWGKRRMMTNDK